MKKYAILTSLMFCLGACSSTHQGTKSLNVDGLALQARPLQVSVVPGEKISGSVKCVNFLGIPLVSPSKEAYGARLETSDGNFSGDKCTRGAIYNAIVSSNADVILSPQYMTDGVNFLCIPFTNLCMYHNTTTTVTGYKGTYQNIREMPEHVIESRFSGTKVNPDSSENRLTNFFTQEASRAAIGRISSSF